MANQEHVDRLLGGVKAWNEWRNESEVAPDLIQANLSGADLRYADLNGAKLRNADLSSAKLSGARLREADLIGAYLSGADLSGADLRCADLIGADLIEADPSGADLIEADLSGAKLSKADLSGAYLTYADLRNADLIGADLIEADLSGADLSGVNFATARVGYTHWTDVDLSEARGLVGVQHRGPSSVGTDTLAKSKGRIPEKFLKGCGLADWEIENAKLYNPDLSPDEIVSIQYRVHELRAATPIQYYSVFISYSHKDKDFASALHDALQKKGIRCWRDEKQFLPGDDIHEQIDRGIRLWDKVILCASEASLTSWWVDKELTTAFDKEALLMKERGAKVLALIPLDLDGFLFNWTNGKAVEVRSRFAGDFRDWRSAGFDLAKAVDSLIRALRTDGGGREPPPPQRL